MPSFSCSLRVIFAAVMITFVSTLGAAAGQVTVNFTGMVSMVNPGAISGTKAGDPFSGKLVYDDSTPVDTPGANPAVYTTLPPLASGLGMTLTIGGNTYSAETGDLMQLKVGNDLTGMFPDVFTAVSFVNVGGSATVASFGLADTTGTAFSSTALPTSLDLSKFDFSKLTLGTSDHTIFVGDINLQSVPEPSSVILLGFAAVVGACVVRRRVVRAR